jgi:O-antigen/teichoic acid export membrane protein
MIGLGLTGLVLGWALSAIFVAGIGLLYLVYDIEGFPTKQLPNVREQLIKLYSFAKYSWLGSVKAQTNNYADILILGIFVPNDLIGVYAVCWNIASFLTIFGSSISQTLFPEFSQLEQEGNDEEIAELLRKSIQYTGMFVIPGLFGGILLGERILRLYGPDFTVGVQVLFLLIIAVWVFDYQKQLTNALQGMNKPNLDFRVNAIFIGSNIVLNVVLITLVGWIGAAVATAASSLLSMAYAYYVVNHLVEITLPYQEISKQVLSAIVMSGVVFILERVETDYSVIGNNFVTIFVLVVIGAIIYIVVLVTVSRDTRQTIRRNIKI